MMTGYEQPLYILPFDHRHSFITGVFHWQDPLTADQVADIVASKQVIYDGFKAAIADSAVRDRAGILVDERFGAAVLRDASGPRLHHVRLRREERSGRVRLRVCATDHWTIECRRPVSCLLACKGRPKMTWDNK